MKLNNKGISLIELILSMVLLSTVLLIMYNLIFKVSALETMGGYAIKNQINRSEIIKTIENDLIENKLYSINVSNENNIKSIIFNFSDNSISKMNIYNEDDKDYIEYIGKDGSKTKWAMNGASINYNGIKVCSSNIDSELKLLTISIMINTNVETNSIIYNNIVDDIVITYVGTIFGQLEEC